MLLDERVVDRLQREGGPLADGACLEPALEVQGLRVARERGLPVLDGLAMLVYQGVIGFELWTRRKAPESVMKVALRRALGLM